MTKRKATYISGPVTGIPNGNREAFAKEAARLRALGHEVYNPAEVDLGPDASWEDYMRVHIPELCKRDAISLLPAWEKSKGAVLELSIACQLGFEVSIAGEGA